MIEPLRQILATSGGWVGSPRGPRPGPLLHHALSLSGKARPRLCFVNTASGDATEATAMVFAGFAGHKDAVVTHLELFPMPNVADPAGHLLEQDLIWVGGGSVANLLAVWRVHGLDDVLRACWEKGVVLGGVSAGSICWHVGGTTDSFGPDLQPVTNGLGLLPYSNGVHHDSEEQRRPLLHKLIADRTLPDGYATDNGVGLHYIGTDLHEVVSETAGAAAYRVERTATGEVIETRLEPRLLAG